MSVAYIFPFCVWFRIGKCGKEFLCGGGGSVICCDARELCVLRVKLDGVYIFLGAGVVDVDPIASVMFHIRA